jgi:preprotein translocase subunit SecA
MIENIIKAVFGDPDKKKIEYYKTLVEQIKLKEEEFKDFSLDNVKAKTEEFKKLFE